MKKAIWLILLPLLLGGCSLGGGHPLAQVTIDQNGQNIGVAEGKSFQVLLPSNVTTGYSWEVVDITTGVLELVNSKYQPSDEYAENMVGAGGEETFTFKVLKVERSHIVMECRRPWDTTDVANEFLLTVNGNPGDDNLLTFVGTIHSNPAGAQFDDYFQADSGEKFGIASFSISKIEDPGIKAKIAEFKDSGKKVEIRGELNEDAIDVNGQQFIIHEIQEKAQ